MFKYVKLTTDKAHSWDTAIDQNMENEEIKDYFYNKFFNVDNVGDNMQKVIKVEFLFIANFEGKFKDAIGISQNFKDVKVWAEDEEKANINLYVNYDHIYNLSIKQYKGVQNGK